MNDSIPKDPYLLLSYVNLKLRDYYSTLEDMCKSLDINQAELVTIMAGIDYEYSADNNQFI